MFVRHKIYLFFLLIGFIVLSIFFVDRPLVGFLHHYISYLYEPAQIFTNFCDTVFQNIVLVWAVFILTGSILFFLLKNKIYGMVFFASIIINLLSSYSTSQIKSVTDRARPKYFLDNPSTADFFSKKEEVDSFPSAHASFYWSIFLPFAFVFRRYAVFLLLVPLLISVSRIVQNHHYLSDVLASFVLVWFFSELIISLFYALYIRNGDSLPS